MGSPNIVPEREVLQPLNELNDFDIPIASVYSGHVYSADSIKIFIIIFFVLRGRVACVRWIYSSGDDAAAQVEDTKCLVKKRHFFDHVI